MSSVLTTFLAAVATAAGGALVAAIVNAIRQLLRGDSPLRQAVISGLIGAAIGFAAALIFGCAVNREPTLKIYSSLPGRELGGTTHKPAGDVRRAIDLALKDADGKVGKFKIEHVALDPTDEDGAFTPQSVQANARKAAQDGKTAVYIGDFSSTASIQSIPVLSEARIPQISPSSTRVGLTLGDEFVDTDEPEKYYPNGYRNFARIIPNDDVQAAAVTALMKAEGCEKVAIIYDGRDYSQGLAVLMTLFKKPKRAFREDVRPKEGSRRYTELARLAKSKRADCFQYIGDSNPNTYDIFRAFADELPGAKLYGTDGVTESSLKDPDSGELADFATRVRLMRPPRDLNADQGFRESFAQEYDGQEPDPYAIYGYEAMRLALAAIKASGSGDPGDVREQLLGMRRSSSVLGSYSIDEDSGDTSLIDYDVFRFKNGRWDLDRAVSPAVLERSMEVLRKRKARE